MSRFHARRESKLRQLHTVGPLVAASLCRRMTRCGNANCRCASGQKHESWCLTYKEEGRTRTVHIPRDMLEEVRQWVEEHKRAKQLLKDISYQSIRIIKQHVPHKRAAARVSEKG